MNSLQDTKIMKELDNQKRSLQLPFLSHQILDSSLTKLKSSELSRYWTLPGTKFPDEVEYYSSEHKKLSLNGPRPKLLNSISSDYANEISLRVSSGLDFLDLSVDADPQIRPILIYYSCAQLCGVFSRAFFDWSQDKRTHGIKCIYNKKDVSKTEIILQTKGQFPRLATTCFILSGNPSCFSELVSYTESPSEHTGKGELLEEFGKVKKGAPITKLTLKELMEFDYGHYLNNVKSRHGFHKFSGLPTTLFLIDVIIFFVSSSLARYDIIGWKEILEGKNNPYKICFDDAFDRFQNFTVNMLIRGIANPLERFDKPLVPSNISPYSHRDQYRFKTNPYSKR